MPARSVLTRAAGSLLGLVWLGSLSCTAGAPRTERFAALLRAHTPSGEPIAGARAWADGRSLGTTAASGALRAELYGREGGAVELTIVCPPAYRTEPGSRRLILRKVHDAAGGAERGALELDVRCAPIEVSAALIVLADARVGSGLPVRVEGEVIGQIERDGSAHLLVTAPAASTLHVQIDTSERPDLQPRSPVHTFRLEDQDSILLVEQSFARVPRVRRAPRPWRPPAAHRRPERID